MTKTKAHPPPPPGILFPVESLYKFLIKNRVKEVHTGKIMILLVYQLTDFYSKCLLELTYRRPI